MHNKFQSQTIVSEKITSLELFSTETVSFFNLKSVEVVKMFNINCITLIFSLIWSVVYSQSLTLYNFKRCKSYTCKNLSVYELPDRIILLSGQAVYWDDSRRICQDQSGQLLTIRSQRENDLIFEYLKVIKFQEFKDSDQDYVNIWIGATDKVIDSQLVWVPDLSPVNYTNWIHGTPDSKPIDHHEDHCLALYFINRVGLFWNHQNCRKARRFMCEIRRVSSSKVVEVVSASSYDVL